jgi:2,3-bisphosphoglycerate-dependent phosphoglycerate mutase
MKRKEAEMKKLKVYLFRHGKTVYNTKGIFTGWKDSKLTAEGRKHAKIIAEKLKNKKFQVAIQTHLSRSKDTLKPVLKYHPECKVILTDDRMIERNYGDLNGTSHEKFIQKVGKRKIDLLRKGDLLENLSPEDRERAERFFGKQEYDVIHRGWDSPPPHGESFKMVEARVRPFIKWLKKYMKDNNVSVAISAHGNSIRLFRKIVEKASIKETVKWFIPYDKVFVYDVDEL